MRPRPSSQCWLSSSSTIDRCSGLLVALERAIRSKSARASSRKSLRGDSSSRAQIRMRASMRGPALRFSPSRCCAPTADARSAGSTEPALSSYHRYLRGGLHRFCDVSGWGGLIIDYMRQETLSDARQSVPTRSSTHGAGDLVMALATVSGCAGVGMGLRLSMRKKCSPFSRNFWARFGDVVPVAVVSILSFLSLHLAEASDHL